MFNRASWLSLIPFVVICFAAAGVASLASRTSAPTWYAQLRRPGWTPPNWLFAPLWTTLYVMMAISAWLIWRGADWSVAKFALTLFAIQLVLNAIWSVMFFSMRKLGPAFGEILLLWTMVIATTVAFLPISLLAAWLLVPYVAWVAFASYLNFRIWQMN